MMPPILCLLLHSHLFFLLTHLSAKTGLSRAASSLLLVCSTPTPSSPSSFPSSRLITSTCSTPPKSFHSHSSFCTSPPRLLPSSDLTLIKKEARAWLLEVGHHPGGVVWCLREHIFELFAGSVCCTVFTRGSPLLVRSWLMRFGGRVVHHTAVDEYHVHGSGVAGSC